MKRVFCLIFGLILMISICVDNHTVCAEELQIAPNCKSAVLIDAVSGEVLLSQDADKKLPVASIVKLMTLKITFDKIDKGELSLSDELVASEYACSMGGSQLFLDPNTKHKLSDLLKSVIVASANDSSVVLAESICGSENVFVREMNTTASVLGLSNTLYTDCTGLREDQYSSALDVAKLSSVVFNHPIYKQYAKIWCEEYIHPSGRVTEIANTNKLIRTLEGCEGGKTGTTDNAGYCLSILTKRNDMSLIAVVLGADSTKNRFEDNKNLINFGFVNFENHNVLSTDTSIGVLENNKVKPENVELYPSNDFGIVARKGKTMSYEVQTIIYDIDRDYKGGEEIGKAYIYNENELIGEVGLIAKEDVSLKSYKDYISDIIEEW